MHELWSIETKFFCSKYCYWNGKLTTVDGKSNPFGSAMYNNKLASLSNLFDDSMSWSLSKSLMLSRQSSSTATSATMNFPSQDMIRK